MVAITIVCVWSRVLVTSGFSSIHQMFSVSTEYQALLSIDSGRGLVPVLKDFKTGERSWPGILLWTGMAVLQKLRFFVRESYFHLSKCICGNADSMVFCPNLKALLIFTAAFGLFCF